MLQRQVALAVARAYLLVVSQKRVLEVSNNARVTAEAHFEYLESGMRAGSEIS